jgi:hypothetical protein
VRAAFFAAQAVARRMIAAEGPGSIINMSSQMGHVGGANRSLYCASKWAMEGFSKAMAIELGAAPHPRQHALPDLHRDADDKAVFRERRVHATACCPRSNSAGSAQSRT